MIQKTLEETAENKYTQGIYIINGIDICDASRECFIEGAKWQKELILQFLYDEITERRDYSASKMCEKVIEFINNTK